MKPSARVQRIPWRIIGFGLAVAALVAWTVGFVIGLVVRFWFVI